MSLIKRKQSFVGKTHYFVISWLKGQTYEMDEIVSNKVNKIINKLQYFQAATGNRLDYPKLY